VLAGVAVGTTVAVSVPHRHRAPATETIGFRTIATTPRTGVSTSTTGKPDWLPAGARLVRHDVDEYGVAVWIFALVPKGGVSLESPPMVRIVALPATTLQAPDSPDDTAYASTAQDVNGSPGQLLRRHDGGLTRLDFLRDGIAYTVIATSGGDGTPPDLESAAILHIAEGLEP